VRRFTHCRPPRLTPPSIGSALVDTLDTFIAERRIEPQVALQLLLHFDRNIAEVLGEKVKARMTFKVRPFVVPKEAG
jgi:hypothetical protein